MALGDEAALESLYQTTSPMVYGLAVRILRDRISAEEVVVEVYAQAWRQARRYDPVKSSVTTWLCVLARTRAIDLSRSRARFLEHESAIDEDFDRPAEAAGPLDGTAASENAAAVRRALVSLPPEQRRAVEAAFFGGQSHSEIAAALGLPLGTVKTRIRAGLLALRRALAPLEEELA